jgi:hypothetical protein
MHPRAATGASQELTAQEAQVAQLARDGLSNPEMPPARISSGPRNPKCTLPRSPSGTGPPAKNHVTFV